MAYDFKYSINFGDDCYHPDFADTGAEDDAKDYTVYGFTAKGIAHN